MKQPLQIVIELKQMNVERKVEHFMNPGSYMRAKIWAADKATALRR
jgi:hypothetical protein